MINKEQKEIYVKQQVIKIIGNTTDDVSDLLNKIDDCFQHKQYHMILHHLENMKKTIERHSCAIKWICFNHSDYMSIARLESYKNGNDMLVNKFTIVYDNIYKDVIANYTMDNNDFH